MKLKKLCINGKFKPTLHLSIMEQLRIKADRFRKQGRLQDQDLEEIIREIKEGSKTKVRGDSGIANEVAKDERRRVSEAIEEGLLQIHGTAPNTKQQGIFHIKGENCNGLNNRISGNEKIAKAIDIREDLDIDCLMYCKHRLNFKHKENKNNLKQMFQQELACTAVSAHNIHEGKVSGRVQEGGTGTICFGEMMAYIKMTGQDSEGLGQWSWVLYSRTNGHSTRVIMAYNLCKNKNVNLGTTYQQQCQYFITKKKDLLCPLVLFHKHLLKQIKEWQLKGDRIILFMDHNEHVINSQLGKALADKDGPDLQEAIMQHTGTSPGATFFRGSKPIDGLWVSNDLDISNACVMPFGYSIGNHRAFILDIPIESLVGENLVKIVHPVGRQLNSTLPGCSQAYIESLEGNIRQP
jgi:hypothetical protein